MEKRVPHEQLCGIFQYYENRTENISKKQHRKTCLCLNQCLASGDMDHQPFLMAEPLFSGNFPFFHADRSLSCLCNIRNAWKYGI